MAKDVYGDGVLKIDISEEENQIFVSNLQIALQHFGIYNGDVTGKYDKKTKTAVTNFQKQYDDLQNDGVVEEKTRNKIWERIYADIIINYGSNNEVTITWK